MNKIQVTRTGSISVGEYIAAPDFDYDEEPEQLVHYDAKHQPWVKVVARGGHADIGWLTVYDEYFKEESKIETDWDQWVWRLVDENDRPVLTY